MPLKLLALGDIHLGRRPGPLPADGDPRRLGPAEAWRRTVEAALEASVHAVVLAGDVVEREDDFFEAYRALAAGAERLVGAGIAVVAVAGNHDGKVLPRLADEIGALRLLGRGERWESCLLEGGDERVRLWGWSMAGPSCRTHPLEGVSFPLGEELTLGLLHTDRDGSGPYAPTSTGELEGSGLDGWLLGHVHRPDPLVPPRPMGYLGSLCGLDRSETGPRGPWLVVVDGGRVAAVDHWALAPLRWERLELDLAGLADVGALREALLGELRRIDRSLAGSRPPEAVGVQVLFRGRSVLPSSALAGLVERGEIVHEGEAGTAYFVASLEAAVEPLLDLRRWAGRVDPPGLLARRLLALDGEGPERDRLVAAAREVLEAVDGDERWARLEPLGLDGPGLREELRRQGLVLLEALAAQEEDGR